jgi:hypothetical protein
LVEEKVVDAMIVDHFKALRSCERFKKAFIRVFIEANMSFITADHVANLIRDRAELSPVDVVRHDPQGTRYGIWTSEDSKKQYADRLRTYTPAMTFAQEFVDQIGNQKDRDELILQMGNFRREMVEGASPEHQLKCKEVFTGKGPGMKDDFVLALCIALVQADNSIYDDIEFRNFLHQTGRVAG